jgi:hypothetical protein
MLLQPKSHQFNFRLLVGDDLLRQPAHLRVFPVQQLCFGHVDCRLMVGQHQLDEINVAVARRFDRSHAGMHCVHARHQLGPGRLGFGHAAVRVRVLSPCGQSNRGN